MKILKSLLILGLAVSFSIAEAQTDIEPCGSGHIHDQLIQSDSLYSRSITSWQQRLLQIRHSEEEAYRSGVVYTLPVVVHVMHEGEDLGSVSNISDEQIYSAIEALNEDFRKISGTNGDGDGVDVEIEFCLATRNPADEPTTGINRVDASVIENYAEMGIEATSGTGAVEEDVKALSTWPREDYVNIWIVNEIEDNDASGGIQGYAYFPYDNPVDGIVCLYNAFGTVGSLKPSTSLNRTLTHEVGHYLGLYHTFHSSTDCVESNCATQGDQICDTPVTTLNSSCSNPACSGEQQVENYMDYTSESCKNLFTEGQKERMRATLIDDRGTLLDSFGCVPVTDFDAGISNIFFPSGSTCNTTIEPEIALTNYGGTTLTSCSITYGTFTGGENTYSWSGSLSSGVTETVELPGVGVTTGDNSFYIYTHSPNGTSDENSGNDEMTSDFVVATGSTLTLEVVVDYFGLETTWEIKQGDTVHASGGPYINNQQGTSFEESICVPAGCYDLWFYDVYGDGMGFTNGDYYLYDSDGTLLIEGGGNFGYETSDEFCVEEPEISDPPTPNFTSSSNSICSNMGVNFQDSSTGNPTLWSWSFEGGSPSTSNQENPQNITYSSPGLYDVTLTVTNDGGSNSFTLTNYVSVSDGPSVSMSTNDVSCNGLSDGYALANVTGIEPISYDWNQGSDSPAIYGIGAGNYDVSVTDGNGCIAYASGTVGEPSSIIASVSAVDPACHNLNNGTASVNYSGGVGNLEVEWSNGSSSDNLSGLAEGNYNVVITDENGCTTTQNFALTAPAQLVSNLSVVDIGCGNETGSAMVDIEGGTAPYTVLWNSTASGNQIDDLNAGGHDLLITDSNVCSLEEDFNVEESESLSLNMNVDEISCFGMADGSISVEVFGGSGSYTYDWNTGDETTSISNLGSGDYIISVIDSEGCEGTATVKLGQPAPLEITMFKSDISCFGMQDGSISLTPFGGTAPYGVEWNHGESGAALYNLVQGTYTANITDDNGCENAETINIVEPSELVISVNELTSETCEGQNGSGVVNIMGGTNGYTIYWSNGSLGQNVENLSSGFYTVEVIDGNGCSAIETLEIQYDCDEAPDPTELVETDCNSQDVTLEDIVTCNPVVGASMYQWKFENIGEGLFTEEYTIGSNNTFSLNQVTNLPYGISVNVCVKVMVNDIWSNYGSVCTIHMADDIPLTQLGIGHCDYLEHQIGDIIGADNVLGATAYEWKFESESMDTVLTSYINELALLDNYGFIESETYEVQVRSEVANNWSEWGEICEIGFTGISSTNIVGDGDPQFNIFPNPGDGEKITLDFWNIYNLGDVIEIEVYDASGKLLENITLSMEQRTYTRLQHRFNQRLSSGMYFIQCKIGTTQLDKEKLIIR